MCSEESSFPQEALSGSPTVWKFVSFNSGKFPWIISIHGISNAFSLFSLFFCLRWIIQFSHFLLPITLSSILFSGWFLQLYVTISLNGFFSSMLQFPVEHFIPAFRCAVSKNSPYSLKVQSPFAFLSQLHKRKGRAVFLQNPRATSAASSLLLSPSVISGSLLVFACHLQCLETNGYLPTLLNSSTTLMSLHFVGTSDCAASRASLSGPSLWI